MASSYFELVLKFFTAISHEYSTTINNRESIQKLVMPILSAMSKFKVVYVVS